jgi:hypothetical protein
MTAADSGSTGKMKVRGFGIAGAQWRSICIPVMQDKATTPHEAGRLQIRLLARRGLYGIDSEGAFQ